MSEERSFCLFRRWCDQGLIKRGKIQFYDSYVIDCCHVYISMCISPY